MRARRLDLAPPDVEIVLVEISSTLRRRRLMVVDGDGHSLQRTERSFRWSMTHVRSRSSTIAPAPITIPNRTHGHTALLRVGDVVPLATLGTTDGLFAKSAGSPRSCRGESRRVRLLNPVPGMPRLAYVPRVPTLTLAPRGPTVVRQPQRLAGRQERDDVRLLEPRRHANLAREALVRHAGRELRREHFHHDLAAERALLGYEHARHSAAAELALELVGLTERALELVAEIHVSRVGRA